MCVVCGFLMVPRIMVLCRFPMMTRRVSVMFRGLSMMISCFLRHEHSPLDG
jgi:hypothetical protein